MALVLRFIGAGLLSTATYFILANAGLLLTDIAPATVSFLAYCGGIIVSYIAQSRYTFRAGRDSSAQITRFLVLSATGLIISHSAIVFTENVLSLPAFYGTIGVCIIIPVFNFLVMKLWVFDTSSDVSSGNAE